MSQPGRIQARPRHHEGAAAAVPIGLQPLPIGGRRDSYLYLPRYYDAAQPHPLVLLLHGSGGHAHQGLSLLQALADDTGLILLAPASSKHTWDAIGGSFGPDVALLDRALEHAFEHYAVDTDHLAIGGFSDGASYALSVGLTNGDLFSHVIAFSPGFVSPAAERDQPRLFVSHGRGDEVLPINPCSRRLVPQLRQAGYDVEYREFDGGHTIPAEIAKAGVDWFLADKSRPYPD